MTQETTNPYRAVPTTPITSPAPVVEDRNVRYWSRAPGKFVNKLTGIESASSKSALASGPQFLGTVREWYETLAMVIDDAALTVANRTNQWPQFLECSPEFLTILETTVRYRSVYYANNEGPKITMDGAFGEYVGVLDNKYHVHVSRDVPDHMAKLVLVTNKKVTKTKVNEDKLIVVTSKGTIIPSEFKDDWRVAFDVKEEQLPSLTRLDGISIEILDLKII